MFRLLLILFLSITAIQCGNKPYRPNYNTSRTHNGDVASRNRIVQRQSKRDIKAANKARKRASRKRVDRMNKRHQKKSEKRNYSRGKSRN
ncbi:MAG: hypothetical protein HYR91_00455 [Flavobacteriia bacterium]|nr:hypothetical protein [Flavobacteriia bacterium]